MKTFRVERHGFEIDIPDEWTAPDGEFGEFVGMWSSDDEFVFECSPYEAFNIIVGRLVPEPSLDETEREFGRYASEKGYTDLELGRMTVLGKEHVWARYHMGGGNWTKKYMIVFVGREYAITATARDFATFGSREKIWDDSVTSIRLLQFPAELKPDDPYVLRNQKLPGTYYGVIEPQQDYTQSHSPNPPTPTRINKLYYRAYDAVTKGRYSAARLLLEECLRLDPNFRWAHKEMAVVLATLGDVQGAVEHRQQVKRIYPSDTINRYNLATMLASLERFDEALKEANELLVMAPKEPRYIELVALLKKRELS